MGEHRHDDSEMRARRDAFRTATAIDDLTTLRELEDDDAALLDDASDSIFGVDRAHTSLFAVRTDAEALTVLRVHEHGAASVAARLNMRGHANRTALFTAAMHSERTSIARVLLEHGADAHARDELDQTPLHFAANSAVVALLLAHGASVNAQDANGKTPLFRAVRTGRVDVVRALLNAGADIHHCDARGRTAMFESDLITDSVGTLSVLLAHGASVTVAAHKRETPLHRAATYGKLATVRFLVDHDATIDATTASCETPLYQAASFDRRAVVAFLLQRGASVHGNGASDTLPVIVAARHGHLDTVADLLAYGAVFGSVRQQQQPQTRVDRAPLHPRLSTVQVLDVLIKRCDAVMPQQLRAAAVVARKWLYLVETALYAVTHAHKTLWRPVIRKLSSIVAQLRSSESVVDLAVADLTRTLYVQLARIMLQLWQWTLAPHNAHASSTSKATDACERAIASLLKAVDALRVPLQTLGEQTACWHRRLANCSSRTELTNALDSGLRALQTFVCDKLQEGDELAEQHARRRLSALERLYDAAFALLALHNQGAVHGDLAPHTTATAAARDEGTAVEQSRDTDRVRWLPPEALERHIIDPARATAAYVADVYCFGMHVLGATSERKPWGAVSNNVVRVLVLAGRLPTRPSIVSDAQWRLITRMCVREPSKRLAMSDVVDSLLEIVHDERQELQQSGASCV